MRTEDVHSSLFSLLLQVAGVGLLAVLTQLLGPSTRRDYLRRWGSRAIQVSLGVAPFDAMSRLEKGIEAADAEMYAAKRSKT